MQPYVGKTLRSELRDSNASEHRHIAGLFADGYLYFPQVETNEKKFFH